MKALINIGVPPGTKMLKIQRQEITTMYMADYMERVIDGYWIIWLHTKDYIHGTYLKLYNNGKIERITIRVDEECDDVALVKPEDGK